MFSSYVRRIWPKRNQECYFPPFCLFDKKLSTVGSIQTYLQPSPMAPHSAYEKILDASRRCYWGFLELVLETIWVKTKSKQHRIKFIIQFWDTISSSLKWFFMPLSYFIFSGFHIIGSVSFEVALQCLLLIQIPNIKGERLPIWQACCSVCS